MASIKLGSLSDEDLTILEAVQDETQANIKVKKGAVTIAGEPCWVLWAFYLLIRNKERDAAILGIPLDSIPMWEHFYGYQLHLNREAKSSAQSTPQG